MDAFWYQATGVVKNNLTELRFQILYRRPLHYDPCLTLGPWPLRADNGISYSVGMVCRTTKMVQKSGTTIKHLVARKFQGALTKLWNASPCSGWDITFQARKFHYHAICNPNGLH